MNPLTELNVLTEIFPDDPPLIRCAEHVPKNSLPTLYRDLLAHDAHMTVAMERQHGCAVDVKVLEQRLDGALYCRKILLLKTGTEEVVQFGIVRFHLQYVTDAVRADILSGETPLGRILIQQNVLRHVDLGALLRITPGESLLRYFGSDSANDGSADVLYGRLATIFCDQKSAVDLLEISAPLIR